MPTCAFCCAAKLGAAAQARRGKNSKRGKGAQGPGGQASASTAPANDPFAGPAAQAEGSPDANNPFGDPFGGAPAQAAADPFSDPFSAPQQAAQPLSVPSPEAGTGPRPTTIPSPEANEARGATMTVSEAVDRTTVAVTLEEAVSAVDNEALGADDEHDAVVKALNVASKEIERKTMVATKKTMVNKSAGATAASKQSSKNTKRAWVLNVLGVR